MRRQHSRNCSNCVHHIGSMYCRKNHYTECSDFERENMPNIKITAEVDGKQVPLETVSTETFEAIKALEKPKEIPVARLADARYFSSNIPRLLFKPAVNLRLDKRFIYALSLKNGTITYSWEPKNDEFAVNANYENIRPL